MISRPKVPVICPSRSPIVRSTASLHRVPWGGFPDFRSTLSGLRPLASPPAALRCLRLAVPPAAPLRSPGWGNSRGLDYLLPRRPHRLLGWRERDLPGSWVTLSYMPRSTTPADLSPLAKTTTKDAAFRSENSVGSAFSFISGLNRARGLNDPCVRFAAGIAPGPRNTRYRLVARLCRTGLTPVGH